MILVFFMNQILVFFFFEPPVTILKVKNKNRYPREHPNLSGRVIAHSDLLRLLNFRIGAFSQVWFVLCHFD